MIFTLNNNYPIRDFRTGPANQPYRNNVAPNFAFLGRTKPSDPVEAHEKPSYRSEHYVEGFIKTDAGLAPRIKSYVDL